MATITDLHTSISQMSSDQLYIHIRNIRSLRREMPIKPIRKAAAKKPKQKQLTIDRHLKSLDDRKRAKLLESLLTIQRRKHE